MGTTARCVVSVWHISSWIWCLLVTEQTLFPGCEVILKSLLFVVHPSCLTKPYCVQKGLFADSSAPTVRVSEHQPDICRLLLVNVSYLAGRDKLNKVKSAHWSVTSHNKRWYFVKHKRRAQISAQGFFFWVWPFRTRSSLQASLSSEPPAVRSYQLMQQLSSTLLFDWK